MALQGKQLTGEFTDILVDALGRLVVVTAVAAPLVMDVIDRAGRLVGIVYGENAQLQQLTPADGVVPNESLETAAFGMVYDQVAGDWNRVTQGSVVGSIIVEDTGVNTNPERYIQDNKFSSWPIDRAGAVATLLYGAASPAGHARTPGLDITIHWIIYHNHSGGPATVWLEAPGGTVQTPITQLADDQTVLIPVKPFDIGDEEIFVNASANDVQAQIGGIET